MESFSADWLALREPADHAARSEALVARVADALSGRVELQAVDLAAGSGSNVRYLLPRLPAVAHWTLVDHDAALLARASRLLTPVVHAAGRSFDARHGDLRALATLPLDGAALVTASGPARPRVGALAAWVRRSMPRGRRRRAVCAQLRRAHDVRAARRR